MDVNRVSRNERLAAAGGLVLLVAVFLDWYGISSTISVNGVNLHNPFNVAFSGWDSVSIGRWIFLITALLGIALAVAKANSQTLNLPITPSVLLAGLGGISALWILLRIVAHPADHLSVKFGIFVALAGAALLAYGAYQAMQEEGASFDEVRRHTDRLTRPDA